MAAKKRSLGSPLPSPEAVAELYAAATDVDQWKDFSKLVGKLAGIEDVAVWISEDDAIRDMSIVDTWRSQMEPYRTHFRKIDPWSASLAVAPPETVMLGYEHMSEDELVKTEFYNDFARPGGMFRPMGARVALAPRTFATIGSDLPGAKKHFEERDKGRLRGVLPYVKSALQLRMRVAAHVRRVETAALHALSFGVIICNAASRVAFVNVAAESLARGGAGVTLGRQGVVAAIVPAEARKLQALIRDAAGGGPGGVVRLSGSAKPTVALVTPLPLSPRDEPATGYAMVSLRPAWDSPPLKQAMLEQMFQLSPVQAAIALALFDGRSPEKIALQRNSRISTVRTHIVQILARTGASSLRDLVRLLGALPPVR